MVLQVKLLRQFHHPALPLASKRRELLLVLFYFRGSRRLSSVKTSMALHLKDEWENFVVEQLRGPYVKEFGKLKTDGERYKFCKYIIR